MGDFHLNLRCAGMWALVATLSLLPPWVRPWMRSISTLWLFSVFIWSCFGSLGFTSLAYKKSRVQSPLEYISGVSNRQKISRRGSSGDLRSTAAQQTLQNKFR